MSIYQSRSFVIQQGCECEESQKSKLGVLVLGYPDSHVTQLWEVSLDGTDNILLLGKVCLLASVQWDIISGVIVTLCQQQLFAVVLCAVVLPEHSVHDRNLLVVYLVHDNITDLGVFVSVPQEQDITSLERRLHGARQHDDYGGVCVGNDGIRLPEHVGRRKHEAQVQELGQFSSEVHNARCVGVVGWLCGLMSEYSHSQRSHLLCI